MGAEGRGAPPPTACCRLSAIPGQSLGRPPSGGWRVALGRLLDGPPRSPPLGPPAQRPHSLELWRAPGGPQEH
eukprot:9968964-Alexandrium_andersonii.AAC.1